MRRSMMPTRPRSRQQIAGDVQPVSAKGQVHLVPKHTQHPREQAAALECGAVRPQRMLVGGAGLIVAPGHRVEGGFGGALEIEEVDRLD
jgi:hypothetical protein